MTACSYRGQTVDVWGLLFALVVAVTSGLASGDDSSPPHLARLQLENDGTHTANALVGGDARLQLIVTAEFSDGELRDWTQRVRYRSEPANIVEISENGLVTPIATGQTTITVADESDQVATQWLADTVWVLQQGTDEVVQDR